MTVFSFKRHTYMKLDNDFVLTVQSRKEGDKITWEIIAIPTNVSEEFHIIVANGLTEEEAYRLHWLISRYADCIYIDDALAEIRSGDWIFEETYMEEVGK